MADLGKNENEVEEVDEGAVEKRPMSTAWKIIVLVLLLLTGAAVGTLYYSGVFVGSSSEVDSDELVEEDLVDENEDLDENEAEDDGLQQKQAIYIPIEPSFVVNLEGTRRVRFLQVTVEMMTRDETAVDKIRVHLPVIRNNLTFLFSSRTVEDISTIQGKEKLRADALKEVQKILEEETGDAAVEALYFTSFVTQ